MGLGDDIVNHITTLKTPGNGSLGLILGIINCIFFGVGTIIAGALEGSVADIIIGVLQLVLLFIGWIWSVVWGVLMIVRSL